MALRVLVVDDSPVMRCAVQRALHLSGLPIELCLAAEDGNTALSLLNENEIDLMLVNVNMSEMSGEDLIRRCHQRKPERRLPFIVMSADATTTRMQAMLDLGALSYLAKPFTPETLRAEVQAAIRQLHANN